MPERRRASLTDLKRPLTERGVPVLPLAEAEAALLGTTEPVPLPPSSEAASFGPFAARPSSLLQRKKKDPKIAWTFKMPLSLHEELSAVATHNELSMTDIVLEALQLHLPNFPHSFKKPG